MNTLIINLTRFGDLLQTQPAISGFAKAGNRVGVVCLDNFAAATDLLRDVDAVYPLAGGNLLAALDADWHSALGKVWQWGEETIGAFCPDVVLNLTATLSVRLLSSHLANRAGTRASGTETVQGTSLRGFGLDTFGFSVNSDPWTTFLQASTRLRGCSPFNLVDLYWMAAGLGSGERVYALRTPETAHVLDATALLAAELPELPGLAEEARGYVAFQLGASEERRRWPLAHFTELGDRLWREERLIPVLLGAKNELHLAERYATRADHPFISLVGKTSLPVLAAVLTQMRLLVTNDTGTMHLAAGHGVPLLAVFLATAQPWDTGPYLESSCTLEPDLGCHPCPYGAPCPHELACRTRISADTVFRLIRGWLADGAWNAPECDEARVWLSRSGDGGFMDLESLSGHEATDRTRWVRQQRYFYSQFLDRAPAGMLAKSGGVRTILPMPRSERLSAHMHGIAGTELSQAAQLLHLLCEQGKVLSVRPTDTTKQRFLGTWQRLQTLWDNSKFLNVLGYLWMCESQEAGNDLATMLVLAEQYKALVSVWHSCLQAE